MNGIWSSSFYHGVAKCALSLCVLALFLVAGGLQAAPIYMIDINRADTPATEPGWTALDVDTTDTTTANNSLVVVDGITFQIFSADGSRYRTTTEGDPNPNPLTADFAFDDGSNAAVGLRFGSPTAADTGTLSAGLWRVEVWVYEAAGGGAGTQIVGHQTLTNGVAQPDTLLSSSVEQHATNPAYRFRLAADGVSYYSVFTRENNSLNRSRLNAVRLTAVPEPAGLGLLLLGIAGIAAIGGRRFSSK